MDALKFIAFFLIAIGAIVNYGASFIVKRMNLAQKVDIKEADELPEEEREKYRFTKAVARIKIIGALILLPGVILVFIAFR